MIRNQSFYVAKNADMNFTSNSVETWENKVEEKNITTCNNHWEKQSSLPCCLYASQTVSYLLHWKNILQEK